jgi:hypothetical protein
MHTWIVAASQTLQALIQQRLESDATLAPFFQAAAGGTMVVSLNNPKEMVVGHLEGVSLWLYRIVRDEELLNAPPERDTARDLRMTPLPIRLHYLITPTIRGGAVNAAELEQTVLGKILQTLYDRPNFRGATLQGDLEGTTVEFYARLEPMTLEEITRIWNALDASYQLSVSYEVGVLQIRSERVVSTSTVLVAEPDTGVLVNSEEL